MKTAFIVVGMACMLVLGWGLCLVFGPNNRSTMPGPPPEGHPAKLVDRRPETVERQGAAVAQTPVIAAARPAGAGNLPAVPVNSAPAVVGQTPAKAGVEQTPAKAGTLDQPILFNTPEADRIVSGMQIFPASNAWHEDISQLPVRGCSRAMLANMQPETRIWINRDMNFVLVPPSQKKINVKLGDIAEESDPGPYPVPENTPIEGWPMEGGTLDNMQRADGGDRHAIVVDVINGMLYEFYQMRMTDGGWIATQASIFDLKSNRMRRPGWTSSDAAGLPIFPSIVRYDELERGEINHALRVTFRKTQRAYVYPATHFASRLQDENLPRMGERLRLRADFDISRMSPYAQTVMKALKKYGMLVADNGLPWRMSISPDPRIRNEQLEDMRRAKGSDFEIVMPTGPEEGPRAKS